MKPKDRIILLQKQLAVAVKALKALKELSDEGISVSTADFALEEIERIKIVQEGIRP